MIIKRELQNATWEFDTEKNQLCITKREPSGVFGEDNEEMYTEENLYLTKVEMFSLSRFLIRSMQKMSQKERKLKKES